MDPDEGFEQPPPLQAAFALHRVRVREGLMDVLHREREGEGASCAGAGHEEHLYGWSAREVGGAVSASGKGGGLYKRIGEKRGGGGVGEKR